MDTVLIVLGLICIVVGIAGSILPVLPGIPVSYLGLILLHLTKKVQFETNFLLLWGGIVLLVTLLDYFLPIWGTKKFGGTKRGVWGSTLGMIIGLFFVPWGIILGPFVGAILGEMTNTKDSKRAFKAGFGAFLGFFVGTIAKMIVGGFFLYYGIRAIL